MLSQLVLAVVYIATRVIHSNMEIAKEYENYIALVQDCRACVTIKPRYAEIINTQEKPSIEFEVLKKWIPRKVKCLLIAESPPRKPPLYFYNDKTMGNLKTELFKLLGIESDTILSRLTEFKERGFFLIDTVKCRCDKRGRSTIPSPIVRTCARKFLQNEISFLKPRKICVVGRTALTGLGEVEEFEELKKYSIRDDCGKQLNLHGYDLVLCLFPNLMNKPYYPKIKAVLDACM